MVFVKNAGTAFGVLDEPMRRCVVPEEDEYSHVLSDSVALTRMHLKLDNRYVAAAYTAHYRS